VTTTLDRDPVSMGAASTAPVAWIVPQPQDVSATPAVSQSALPFPPILILRI
jgi:hypothetical protein